MFRSNFSMSQFCAGALLLAIGVSPSIQTASADVDSKASVYSPVVNGSALRGLSTIGSAESMGEGRITFDAIMPWYHQATGYLNTPKTGANIFTGTGAFSYGVNSNFDIFASVAGFSISNNTSSNANSGLGTIRAGAQGSLPFPNSAYMRMGGQASIIGGTSRNQINPNRADGYNYLDTRVDYDFSGKLMQTFLAGSEDKGIKLHLNEGGIIGLDNGTPALMLLGIGLQANAGPVVFGAELNSRTQFKDLSFGTDPLWFTPSVHFRTPYQMNAMAGVDISLSADRAGGDPAALEPFRVFGAVAFSFDMLEGKRNAEFAKAQKTAQEKAALEKKAAASAAQVRSLKEDAVDN
ncbi:MAG: hypothetical protein MUF22_06640, partial [Chitinispirillaceae bacterium]|nr:hypothetical protein [Chitinispirillaceae bacterium]